MAALGMPFFFVLSADSIGIFMDSMSDLSSWVC